MKKLVLFSFVLALSIACTNENANKNPINNPSETLTAFSAKMKINSTTKIWKSIPLSTTNSQTEPVAGIDYFAIRGGINENEMTLVSFGKFADDANDTVGKLTLFLNDVSDIGTYEVGGSTASYGVISIVNNSQIENYSTNQNNSGAVIITKYDLVNNVFSGTFTFNATNGNNQLEITNGSFKDVPFKQ